MEDRIRDIVAAFLRIPATQIGPDTRVDRSALQSSILVHRMYARLQEQGFHFENYFTIKVFGDLISQQRNAGESKPDGETAFAVQSETQPGAQSETRLLTSRPLSRPASTGIGSATPTGSAGIGIDIQDIRALPRTDDFRKETFYKMNFTPAEIAYCILQPDPYASFTGLFAAKEAVIKADAQYKKMVFNTIEIGHSMEGAPLVPGFNLSISHSADVAVAVAIDTSLLGREPSTSPATAQPLAGQPGKSNYAAWIALLLAAASLIIVLWRQR